MALVGHCRGASGGGGLALGFLPHFYQTIGILSDILGEELDIRNPPQLLHHHLDRLFRSFRLQMIPDFRSNLLVVNGTCFLSFEHFDEIPAGGCRKGFAQFPHL